MTCPLQPLDAARFATLTADLQPRCELLRAEAKEHFDFDQATANLAGDPLLSTAHKFELAAEICRAPAASTDDCRDKALAYCDAHPRLGPRLSEPGRFVFGHVMTRKKLRDRFASLADPTLPITRAMDDLMLDEFLRQDLGDQRADLANAALSHYQMWSFIGPIAEKQPYDGLGTLGSDLRRRLGLGFYPPRTEFVYCGLDLAAGPSVQPPTTFDSRLNRYFRPGGKTHPLDGAVDGLKEVVHLPVSGYHLRLPLRATT